MSRIAVVVSHPIPYFVAQYRSWFGVLGSDLRVIFGSRKGLGETLDPGFGQVVSWGVGLLDGYDSEFAEGSTATYAALGQFSPDVVVIYGYSQPISRWAALWSIWHGRRLVYVSDSELRHYDVFRSALKALALRPLFKQIDLVLTVGDANEEFYRRCGLPRSKMLRMHFPIDVESYDAAFADRASLRMSVRAELNASQGELIVLSIGKLTERKRHMDLIEAVGRLQGGGTAVRLLIAGAGDCEPELRRLDSMLGARTIFTGFVTPSRLPGYFAASDVYAHVSAYDPHPLAISEALMMGLPIVASNTVGSWGASDDLVPFRNGLVVETGNVGQIADAIGLLAVSAELRLKMAQASRSASEAYQQRSHQQIASILAGFGSR